MKTSKVKITILSVLLFLAATLLHQSLSGDLIYSLPHEDDLQLSLTRSPSFFSAGIISNEIRVHGAYYFQLLRISAWLDPSWLEGSAKLLALHAGAFYALVFALAATFAGVSAGALACLAWMLSPFALWNHLQLWNLSFLPFYYLAILFPFLLVTRVKTTNGKFALWIAGLCIALAGTAVHQSCLLIVFALTATLVTRSGRHDHGMPPWFALSSLVAFGGAYLYVTSGAGAGDTPTLPHGTIIQEMLDRVWRLPRFDLAFAGVERSLLTSKHLFDGIFWSLLLWNLRHWRVGFRDESLRFLTFVAITAAPLAAYSFVHYGTQPTHFRERYVLLLFLALLLRTALLHANGLRPSRSAQVIFAAIVSLLAAAQWSWLAEENGVRAAIPFTICAGVSGAIFLYRKRWATAALLIALASHQVVYFGTRTYLPAENAGSFIRFRQGRALAPFLRESGYHTWSSLAGLTLADTYGLVALAGFLGNPMVEDVLPPSCRQAGPAKVGIFVHPSAPKGTANCQDSFRTALESHEPLRQFAAQGKLALSACFEAEGLSAFRYQWSESTPVSIVGNYGLPILCQEPNGPSTEPISLRSSVLRTGLRAEFEIASQTNRYQAREALFLQNARVEYSCGQRRISESLVYPGLRNTYEGAAMFPRAYQRHTRDLWLTPFRWDFPPCSEPGGGKVSVHWQDAVAVRDGRIKARLGPGKLAHLPVGQAAP